MSKVATYHGEEFDNYLVYRDGRVWSLASSRYLTPSNCKYPRVHFSKNGKPKKVLLHRLIAESFIPLKRPKDSGITVSEWKEIPISVKQFIMKNMVVNHIDHNKKNYKVDNLEWVTQEENARKRDEYYSAKRKRRP